MLKYRLKTAEGTIQLRSGINKVLMDELDGRKRYIELVRNQDVLKSLFKVVKGLSAGKGIEKVFITGVSPMVMSDTRLVVVCMTVKISVIIVQYI